MSGQAPNYSKSAIKGFLIAFLPLWCAIIAIILWIVGFQSSKDVQTICYGIASTVFSSGVFAVVLKAFQFTSVFREELSKVLFADTNWLSALHPQQFQSIWKNMVTAAVKKSLPDITETLSSHIMEEMVPIAQGYYYADMTREMTITKFDPVSNVITILDSYRVKIKAQDVKTEVDYVFSMSGDWPAKQQEQLFKVDSLFINDERYDDKPDVVTYSGKAGEEASVKYSIKLTGAVEYNVRRHITRNCRLRSDPVMHMIATRYTKSMVISVRNHESDKIKIKMYPVAIKNSSIKPTREHDNLECWNASGLILPGQGIMLVFSEI